MIPRVLRGTPRRGMLVKLLVALVLLILFIGTAGVGFTMAVVAEYSKNLPDVNRLKNYEPAETSYIYAANGQLIATLFKERRRWVPLSKVPLCMRQAILATEDARFYRHSGVDFIGVARAATDLLITGSEAQGASTITMQLTRAIFLKPERSKERKIREMLLALQIEKRFTKDEILELYLNQIYFGSGAHGIQAAASTYFNKKVEQLNVEEAAMLAGLPQKPTEYSPHVNIEKAKIRQKEVLERMADPEVGFITAQQADELYHKTLKIVPVRKQQQLLKYPYFTSYVIKELSKRYPDELLYQGGLRIYTTLDIPMQKAAEKAVKEGAARNVAYGYNAHQAALACVENGTGFIRAMAGGRGWSDSNQFNRAWQATRQPGSTFKIFVYAAAFEYGYTPNSIIVDAPVSFKISDTEVYTPKNADGRFIGAAPIMYCMQISRDIPSIKMFAALGPERVIQVGSRMGIKTRMEPNLSLALGAVDITVLEMAAATSVIPNNGYKIEATPIKLIKDSKGNIIEDNRIPYKETVLSEATCVGMTEMMRRVIEAGTGTEAQIGRPAAGKTGTTDHHRDAWFVGYTPQYTTAVWTGNDDYSPTYGAFGGTTAAPIWRDFMLAAHKGKKVLPFGQRQGNRISQLMCSDSHRLAAATCPSTYRELVSPEERPNTWCRLHSIDTVTGGTFAHKGKLKDARISAAEVDERPTGRNFNPRPMAPPRPPPEPVDVPIDVQATPLEPDLPVPIDVVPPPPPVDVPPPEPPPFELPPEPPPPPPVDLPPPVAPPPPPINYPPPPPPPDLGDPF